MQPEPRFTCFLIGERSLLVLCAEKLLTRGHVICGIATKSAEIVAWAESQSIPILPPTNEKLIEFLSNQPCDYLFSIINHRVLPQTVISLARHRAINFHDAPLPRYAGVYATTWALINRESEHGVTWHSMTNLIDGGEVLKQKRFPISADETAFTLNTKCYDAGFEAFCELLGDIENNAVSPCEQQERSKEEYYALRKRPRRMATFDWLKPAEELDALFRGLDFGPYENPIGRPKMQCNDQILIPRRFTLQNEMSTRPPGWAEPGAMPGSLRVHTSTKIVELADFQTLDGRSADSPVETRLLNGSVSAELDLLLEKICVQEQHWAQRLAEREPAILPYVPADTARDQSPAKRIHHEIDCRRMSFAGDPSQFVSRAVAAISLYLGRLSGKETFDVDYREEWPNGVPSEAVAFFAKSVPLRVRLNWPDSFAQHVSHVEGALAKLKKRGTYARDLVLRYPQLTEEHRQKLWEIPDVAIAVVSEKPADLLDAQLVFAIAELESKITLVTNADAIDDRLLTKIAAELTHVLTQVVADPLTAVGDISIITPAEQVLLDRWNEETYADYEPTTIPSLLDSQAVRTPEAVAIIFQGESICYAELNARANQMARHLHGRGVKRGDLVGVMMDRSTQMLISMIAILKTGAAYVPLDPQYPAHRLAIMVEDSGANLILTQAVYAKHLGTAQAKALCVNRMDEFEGVSSKPLDVKIEPDDLAYVMYTSGSTGRPKGVMITHRSVVNFFEAIDRLIGKSSPGTWLASTSISFDVSVYELFWTLSRGATIVLRGSEGAAQTRVSTKHPARKMDFSLFFSNVETHEGSADREPDRLRQEAASFADEHDFTAVRAHERGPESLSERPEAFRRAGEIGARFFTQLLGQSVESVAKNIALYRQAWKKAGHAGEGHVTLMVHTLVGEDEAAVKEAARGPVIKTLTSDLPLLRNAAWEFPAFNQRSEEGTTLDEFFDNASEQEMSDLLDFAFEHYYITSGLFGTTTRCLAMVDRLKEIGVDEIGCLIDFGLPTERILEHLPALNELRLAANANNSGDGAEDVVTLIERYGITHFPTAPPMAASMTWDPNAHRALAQLKCMLVGGEAMPEDLARQLCSIVSGRVFNVYGPTETTVWATAHELRETRGPVPIGRPIANTQLYVVDERQRPLPIEVPGELLVGGDGVGRGYWNRPELTQSRFLETPQGRQYRTGDLVRLRRDGVVEYFGRIDHQVKIRGHRIELGEIEAVLESNSTVRKAVVHPQDDAIGSKWLVAYIVPKAPAQICTDDLRDFLRQRLPEFMVPSVFEPMDELPLTPSGKIDRGALPKPKARQRQDTGARAIVAPQTETQRWLVELWQKLLGVTEVDVNDNFFELGGHSLLAMRAISQIDQTFKARITTKIFLLSSLSQIASEIDRVTPLRPTIAEREEASKAAGRGFGRFTEWFKNKRQSGQLEVGGTSA